MDKRFGAFCQGERGDVGRSRMFGIQELQAQPTGLGAVIAPAE